MATLTTPKVHVFEHLGVAPYKFIGLSEKWFVVAGPGGYRKPGSSCDHCGTAIVSEFWLKSADGKTFKVGCDCIRKAGDAGLKRVAERAKRVDKAAERRARIDAALADPGTRTKLAAAPHPKGWSGKTLLDWVTWMHAHAGNAGHERIARALKGVA